MCVVCMLDLMCLHIMYILYMYLSNTYVYIIHIVYTSICTYHTQVGV